MVPPVLNIGSRGSRLARLQVDETLAIIRSAFPPETVFATTWFTTPGDRDRTTPLSDPSVPTDYFTEDVDRALLEGHIDLSVNSAKDLPDPVPDGLTVAARMVARDIRDVLVFRRDEGPETSPRTVGTSSPRRADLVRELYPDADCQEIRGDVPTRVQQLDDGDYDAIVVAACALERLGLSDRIGCYLPGESTPQQGRLALVTRAGDSALIEALRPYDVTRTAGLVAIVGCPSDASLLSERALRYIDQADVVLHDRLIPDEILLRIQDRAIAVGKQGGKPHITQHEINRRMLQEAEQGKLVVRLQGGDPGLFGHLGEELEFLDAWNIRSDVVAAPTAAQVLAAHGRTALTHRHRGRSVTFLSGHAAAGAETVRYPGPQEGNLALYMPVANRAEITRNLRDAGWPEDAGILVGQQLGSRDETISRLTLHELPTLEIASPAVMLIGPEFHGRARTTLFVGTNPDHFLNHGPLIHLPLIKLVATPPSERARLLTERLHEFDGLVFPSRFAVPSLVGGLHAAGLDVRALAGKKLLAVGPATARELKEAGLVADLAAESLGGVRDLVHKLTDDYRGRYLYPCSDASPAEQRTAAMRPFGIELEPVVFYRNRPMPIRNLPNTPFDRVLFTSSSTVREYFAHYPTEKEAARTWVAVGPSTLEYLESIGLQAELLQARPLKSAP